MFDGFFGESLKYVFFPFEIAWAIIRYFWWVILIFAGLELLKVIIRGGHGMTGGGRFWKKKHKKAGRYVDKNGYERFSDSGMLVSRWIAEKKLGRKLRNEEVVHHKNRNKLDNSPENLWVFKNQDEHEQAHEDDGDFDDDYDKEDDNF